MGTAQKRAGIAVLHNERFPMPRNYVRMTQKELYDKLEEARKAAIIARREWLDETSNEGAWLVYMDLMRKFGALRGNYHRWHKSKQVDCQRPDAITVRSDVSTKTPEPRFLLDCVGSVVTPDKSGHLRPS